MQLYEPCIQETSFVQSPTLTDSSPFLCLRFSQKKLLHCILDTSELQVGIDRKAYSTHTHTNATPLLWFLFTRSRVLRFRRRPVVHGPKLHRQLSDRESARGLLPNGSDGPPLPPTVTRKSRNFLVRRCPAVIGDQGHGTGVIICRRQANLRVGSSRSNSRTIRLRVQHPLRLWTARMARNL